MCVLYAYPYLGSVPKIGAVFRLYCSLEAGLNVKDLCNRVDMKSEGVNERYAFTCIGLNVCVH